MSKSATGFNQDEADFEELDRVFSLFDADNDGRLVASEIGNLLGSLGFRITKRDLKRILASADIDADGYVTRAELARIVASRQRNRRLPSSPPPLTARKVTKAFRVFDINRDGFITPSELRSVLTKVLPLEEVTDRLVTDMIQGADSDGDGRVSFDDFARVVGSTSSGWKLGADY